MKVRKRIYEWLDNVIETGQFSKRTNRKYEKSKATVVTGSRWRLMVSTSSAGWWNLLVSSGDVPASLVLNLRHTDEPWSREEAEVIAALGEYVDAGRLRPEQVGFVEWKSATQLSGPRRAWADLADALAKRPPYEPPRKPHRPATKAQRRKFALYKPDPDIGF